MNIDTKKTLSVLIMLLLIPTAVILGMTVFSEKQYAFTVMAVTALSCAPFFISFEYGKHSASVIVLIAVMTALSVAGRFVFSSVPGFKPVTALTVLAAIYFGSEAGFMTGALTAVISNFYFGQGPWTPFQMFAWGAIGLCAGILAPLLKKSKVLLCAFGAFAGVFFSLMMDVYTVLWQDGGFNFTRYIAAVVSSAHFTLVYAVSNVVFLAILAAPVGSGMERIKKKYGL